MSFPIRGAMVAPMVAFCLVGLRADDLVKSPESNEASRSGIDRSHADPDVRAQDDLFRHVNGISARRGRNSQRPLGRRRLLQAPGRGRGAPSRHH